MLLTLIAMVILLAGCEQGASTSTDAGGTTAGTWRDSSEPGSSSPGAVLSENPADTTAGGNSNPSVPATGAGVRNLAGGGVEITGVPSYTQGQGKDPHSPGGQSWRPHAYCGPTAFQMVMSYYGVNKSRDYWGLTVPGTSRQVRQGSQGQMYIKDAGAAYPPMVNMAKAHGMGKSQMRNNLNIAGLKSLVAQGRPQIVRIDGPIRYTDGYARTTPGHVIVVVGVTGNGDVIVHDPALSGKRTITGASFRQIWRSPKNFSVDIAK